MPNPPGSPKLPSLPSGGDDSSNLSLLFNLLMRQVDGRLEEYGRRLSKMEGDVDYLKEDIKEMKADIKTVKGDVQKVNDLISETYKATSRNQWILLGTILAGILGFVTWIVEQIAVGTLKIH